MSHADKILQMVAENDKLISVSHANADRRCRDLINSLERRIDYIARRGGLICESNSQLIGFLESLAKCTPAEKKIEVVSRLFKEIIKLHEKAYVTDNLEGGRDRFFKTEAEKLRKKYLS